MLAKIMTIQSFLRMISMITLLVTRICVVCSMMTTTTSWKVVAICGYAQNCFFLNFIVIVMYCYCYVLLSLCIVIVIILLLFYNIVLYSEILCHCILTMRVKIQAKWQIMKKSGHTIFPKWGFMKKSGPTIKQL